MVDSKEGGSQPILDLEKQIADGLPLNHSYVNSTKSTSSNASCFVVRRSIRTALDCGDVTTGALEPWYDGSVHAHGADQK